MAVLKRADLIHPELSYKVVGLLYEVWNELGPGYQEKYYQKATSAAFKDGGLRYQEQKPARLNYKDTRIGIYYMDFLIEDKIILEIKRKEYFSKMNIQQAYGYLRATGLQLAILANFTSKGLQFKRIINEV
jgi:GxxExxY protein